MSDVALRRKQRQITAAVALAAVVVFLPSVATGFVVDDVALIVRNEFVHAWRWLPRAFTTHLWDAARVADAVEVREGAETMRRYYRPIVTVSYLATWAVAGAAPWLFHLTNVLLHGATSALAARAAHRWTRSLPLALAVGLAFALHPSRTENVTWISGRTDVLMLLFVLLAAEGFTAFDALGGDGVTPRPRVWAAFAGGLLATVAAVLSKEPAVMLPFVLLAMPGRSPRRRLAIASAAAVCGTYLVLRALVFPPDRTGGFQLTPGHFLMTVGAYVERVVVPWPPSMFHHTLVFDAAGPVYPPRLLVLGAMTVAAGTYVLVRAFRKDRTAFWLLVAAPAFLGPLLNVHLTDMSVSAQDRFLYAPLLFALGGLTALHRERLEGLARARPLRLVALGAAALATLLVQIRTLDYRSDRTFWEAELHHNPEHPYVLHALARLAAERGELDAAYAYLSRAELPGARRHRLAVTPTMQLDAHFERATLLAARLPDGRAEDLEALLDELWRTVDPELTPAPRVVEGFVVGEPLPRDRLERLHRTTSFHWDAALLASRLGDRTRAERAVARTSPSALLVASSPLNGGLVLLRLGRYADARALHERLTRGTSALALPAEDIQRFGRDLARAEQRAAARERATTPLERGALEAIRLAELGAPLAALRALDGAGGIAAPEVAPLVVQLLVACRLEDAARSHALQHMPSEVASATVDEARGSLPPGLREIASVPGDLDDVLAALRSRRP